MNSLVLVLLASAATGADPQPVISGNTYTYTEAAPENRPGLFGRIRNALNSKSSTSSVPSSTITYPTSPAPVSGTRIWGAATPVAPSVVSSETVTAPTPRFVPSGSSVEPPLADTTPVTTAPPPLEPRPAIPPATAPVPTYTYTTPDVTGTPESNRPRLFSRIRKLVGGSSNQSSQAPPVDMVPPVTVTPRMPIGNP